jgi:uncharacterized membrane protein YccC
LPKLERKLAATRKKQHGQLCNKVLGLGKIVKIEKLSYKSFQKNFGRSVTVRAPGMFVDLLTRKAANAGASVEEINTRKTKLSLDLHLAGQSKRNRLARDIMFVSVASKHSGICSYAFLAEACSNDTLDICQAEVAWPAAEPLLKRAMSRFSTQTANHRLRPASFGLSKVLRQAVRPLYTDRLSSRPWML